MRLTILDEILMESGYKKISSAEASGRKHQTGCNCIQCRNSYMQAGTGNTHWRKRRDARQGFIANKTAKNYENNETLSNEEYDLAPVEDGIRKHVILVAGHNWESPGHKFITYCFNRSKRLIKKDKTLEFTIFDFTSGKVIFGKWVKDKIEWITLESNKPITKDHYTKKGKQYVFKGDPGVLSITNVYNYIKQIGIRKPGILAELSFFGHGWMGGPILVDSYDSYRGENWKPERDPFDNDPRTFKDFEEPNMSSTDLSNFKKAFAADGFVWVWGCAFTTAFFQVLHQVFKSTVYKRSYPKAIADNALIKLSFNKLHASTFFDNHPNFFPVKDAAGKYQLTFSRKFQEITDFIRDGISNTYATAIAIASGVECRSAFLGTYADYEKNVSLPLMVIPRKVPPYSDNFSSYINFYKKYMGMKEDPEGRGYGIYEP